MNIAFISPKVGFSTNIKPLQEFWDTSPDFESYRSLWRSSPGLGLLILAALTPSPHTVEFIDENVDPVDFSRGYDLVGITAMTQQADRAYEIADQFRKQGTKVVLGGIHPTLLPEEAKEHADSVVVGEAEVLWGEILHDVEKNQLQPFYRATRVFDLTCSPVPRYDLLKQGAYSSISVQTSRGCPHDCEYCAASKIFGREYRHKVLEEILCEVNYAKRLFKDTPIIFCDDNFLVNKRLARELLKSLVPFEIRWAAQTDISIGADPEFLKLMKKSGCSTVFIGLESLSPESLQSIDRESWKFRQLKNYPTYIQQIQSHGIGVIGAFMVGLDSDDESVFGDIVNFALENYLFATSITIQTPLPGTRLRERLKQEERLLPAQWSDYTGYNLNHIPKGMSKQELEGGLVSLYHQVYNKNIEFKKMKYFADAAFDRRKKEY